MPDPGPQHLPYSLISLLSRDESLEPNLLHRITQDTVRDIVPKSNDDYPSRRLPGVCIADLLSRNRSTVPIRSLMNVVGRQIDPETGSLPACTELFAGPAYR